MHHVSIEFHVDDVVFRNEHTSITIDSFIDELFIPSGFLWFLFRRCCLPHPSRLFIRWAKLDDPNFTI